MRDIRVVESTLVSLLADDFRKCEECRQAKIFIRFMIKSAKKYMAPSRTIVSRSRMPLPILKALYKVRENITMSNPDMQAHAIARYRPVADAVKGEHPIKLDETGPISFSLRLLAKKAPVTPDIRAVKVRNPRTRRLWLYSA